MFVHRNPPAKTLRLTCSDGQYVVCSVYHRFWRANQGWAQARELKPGDSLRASPASCRSRASSPTPSSLSITSTSPAPGRSSSVGTSLLVHDNTLPDHRLQPFDTLPVVEATASSD